MSTIAYALCALTSLTCFAILLRSYLQNKVPLLLWCSLSFFFFAIQNSLLFVDLVVLQQVNLSFFRTLIGFIGAVLMLGGLIWEQKR